MASTTPAHCGLGHPSPPLKTFSDSGAPVGSSNYTTLTLFPVAAQHNARIITVNRRNYPGSATDTEEDLALPARAAQTAPGDAGIAADMLDFWRARAHEIFDFLADGGFIPIGWSFGSLWTAALLAFLEDFSAPDVQLSKSLRRVILYDGSLFCLGQPLPPSPPPQPMIDPAPMRPEERLARFDDWITSYFPHAHPATPESLRAATAAPLAHPPRTDPDSARTRHTPVPHEAPPADQLLFRATAPHGTAGAMKERWLHRVPGQGAGGADWRGLETWFVLCEKTYWEAVWGAHMMGREIAERREKGEEVREVRILTLKGANHFVSTACG
ncbi:uncharacterized protein BXZ73DRAFT_105801 [Epithele typhae]|uniref:uncharacterized protein n=1 Tax=Epithele typhae TaxID=378194 RepID=UPI00200775D9|nr:uncharacterized protein BXZ73DRAFT_105801 [Epithele typhae]KAH9916608.1 hypothetical protein BXZ73DRAFT_105801 [Epithele typhae]